MARFVTGFEGSGAQPKHVISVTRPGNAIHGPDSYRGVPLTMDALVRDERTRSIILQDEVIIAFVFNRPRLMRMTAKHPGGRAFAESIDDDGSNPAGGSKVTMLIGPEHVVPKCMAKFRDFVA